ncbi:MAG: arginine repressor [Oscillospiraceae bacterium]|jgi:transcriptional regulator of arginine metabolism|nr:arginine repressor [Oscillospiraceae bacterium]
MKSKRHSKILELISDYEIDTQEELLRKLNQNGFKVTQATVSRDIKELRLIKVQSTSGYKYALNNSKDAMDMSFKFHAVFSEAVTEIDYAENIVVIRCYVGMANAACAALDSIEWRGVVGTIAGDDTIFCVMRDKANAADFADQLKKLSK